jgi:hypothetical protein
MSVRTFALMLIALLVAGPAVALVRGQPPKEEPQKKGTSGTATTGGTSNSTTGSGAAQGTGQGTTTGSTGGGSSTGTSTSKASALETLLEKALKQNPDIKVAESKLREADAELNRTRLKVMERLVTLYNDLEAAKKSEQAAKARVEWTARLFDKGAISQQEMDTRQAELLKTKTDLSKLDAELAYLTGKQTGQPKRIIDAHWWEAIENDSTLVFGLTKDGGLSSTEKFKLWSTVIAAKAPMIGDKIRIAMEKTTTLKLTQASYEDVLGHLRKMLEGINLVVNFDANEFPEVFNVQMTTPVTVASVFQWLEDASHNNVRFIVRDYGIAAVRQVPSGAMMLSDFVRPPASEPSKAK